MPWSQVIDRSSAGGRSPSRALQGVVEGVAVALRKMQQPDQPGLAFDECADRRALVLADDQVALPVPGLGAVLGRERPLVDGEHRLLEPGPTAFGALLSAPMISAGAQRGAMLRSQPRRAHQCRSGLVDGLVDALVTQPHRRPARGTSAAGDG